MKNKEKIERNERGVLKMGNRRFSVLAIVFSLVGGFITLILGEFILNLQGGNLPEPIIMGLYFGIGAMVISGMVMFSQMISPQLVGQRWKNQYLGAALKLFIPATFLMLGVTALIAQFVYGIEISKGKEIKDIIIAVDTSGSMNDTDPDKERFEAVNSLIDGLKKDMRVALVTFNENPQLVFDFTPVENEQEVEDLKAQVKGIVNSAQGLTEVKKMMEYTYQLIEKEEVTGRNTSLIIVSDGEPSDNSAEDIEGLVQPYVDKGIPIYTVGMMYQAPEAEGYLERIAEYTEGRHLSTSSTAMLEDAFAKIRHYQSARSLLNERTGVARESLFYAITRVVLLTVLGGLIGLGQGFIFDNKFLAKGLILGGILGGLMGGAAMEWLLRSQGNEVFARGVFLLLFTLLLPMFTWAIEFKEGYHGTLKV